MPFLSACVRAAAAVAASVSFLIGSAWAQSVTGAGASFPAPVYAKWADAFHKATGARVSNQSAGSGAGGKGNQGVAAFVQRLPNSIGDVEYAHAKQNRMSHVLLQNKNGVSWPRTT